MGANATTKVPSYVAGQVLTAADLSITNSGIPVFANSTDRTNSFGGTGEKTLAEGQFAYLEDDNKTYYYDGAAWQQVGGSGFVVVKSETAFSASSSVTLDTAFSSTYRNYKLLVNYTTSTTGGIAFRFRVSNSSVSTATYNFQYLEASDTTLIGGRAVNQTRIDIGGSTNGAFNSVAEVTIFAPNVATPTMLYSQNTRSNSNYTTGLTLLPIGGNQTDSTAFTGFELFPVSGTISGTYTLYGLATA